MKMGTHGNHIVYMHSVAQVYSLTMTHHCVSARHDNDGCLQVALKARLHCTTHQVH